MLSSSHTVRSRAYEKSHHFIDNENDMGMRKENMNHQSRTKRKLSFPRFVINYIKLSKDTIKARLNKIRNHSNPKQYGLKVLLALVMLTVFKLQMRSNINQIINKPKKTINMAYLGYQSRPRVFALYEGVNGTTYAKTLNPHAYRYPSKREIFLEEREIEAQKELANDNKYNHGMRDRFENGECSAQYKWQLSSFPSCNLNHEIDMSEFHPDAQDEEDAVTYLASGYWRDVWTIQEIIDSKKMLRVLKTIRYEHDFEDRNYDRHRRDAVAMERLTASPNVVDIYSFCGNSGIFEYGNQGDIYGAIWYQKNDSMKNIDRLKIAVHVAMAIADLHNFDEEGQSSIAHTDITPSQFIMIDGIFKLNDFNRCRFIRWNEFKDQPCGYHVGRNPGKFRSPEEYRHEIQSEKVDIYSMGNIFYSLLTGLWPFERTKEKYAQRLIMSGQRPPIPPEISDDDDPALKTLIHAIQMCWVQDQYERATARDVEQYLLKNFKAIMGK